MKPPKVVYDGDADPEELNRQTIGNWGMIDVSCTREGTLTIMCDAVGNPLQYIRETAEDTMPMIAVNYHGLGILALYGDRRTGYVTRRIWWETAPGAVPPQDAYSKGWNADQAVDLDPQGQPKGAPVNATRH